MWRETKILLIDDDSARRRDLAVGRNFLGEENLACSRQDWQQVVAPLSSSREVLCVLIGTVNAPGSVLGLVKTVTGWDEFLPVLLLGEISSAEFPEDLRRRVLSNLEMPPSYSQLLDSLHRAQVYREMYDQARERGRQHQGDRTGGNREGDPVDCRRDAIGSRSAHVGRDAGGER